MEEYKGNVSGKRGIKMRSLIKKGLSILFLVLTILSYGAVVEASSESYWEQPLGAAVYLEEPGEYVAYVDVSIEHLVGEGNWQNGNLGYLRLFAGWTGLIVEEKQIYRGLFGASDVWQRIYFEFEVTAPNAYTVTSNLNSEVRIRNNQFIVTERESLSPSQIKAATWNIYYDDEEMDGGECCPAAEAMGSDKKGAWDEDVIFWQEVDEGDADYDDHHIINHIYNTLNKKGYGIDPSEDWYKKYNDEKKHHKTKYRWTASWGWDDYQGSPYHDLESYLLTTVRNRTWFNPMGNSDKDKGYLSKEILDVCSACDYNSDPGAHGQVGNDCVLGSVVGWKYYMNVCKAKLPNGEVIFLANVHLKAYEDYADEREEEVSKAMDILKCLAKEDPDYDGRVLMAGDFNTHQIKHREAENLLRLAREEFGFAIDASMAVGREEFGYPFYDGDTLAESMDKQPTDLEDECNLSERFDTFLLLGEGWRTAQLVDYHVNVVRDVDYHGVLHEEFEIYDEYNPNEDKDEQTYGKCVPDEPQYYNGGKPIADADHLPVRITLNVYPNDYDIYVYVTKAGSPAPTGMVWAPYHVVEAGIVRTRTSPANTVQIAPGKYYETFTTDAPCILKTTGGTITIGKLDYQASTTLEIITLNTHLAGDEIWMPSWQDYERADDIADFIKGLKPTPDVVGFQEIWDEDLFFGGDGANGIWPSSGYLDGDHGEEEGFFQGINSGCALMSKYLLKDFQQVEWDKCSGVDCGAAKGWVQATIVKDGFNIGLFNLHADADADVDDVDARFNQMVQLKKAVNSYRAAHKDHVVFVMGDFNIYGETAEYATTLIHQIGIGAGGRDADRNAPGFVFGNSEQWTMSDGNPLAMHFNKETVSGRLDYIFYFPSLDGSVEVIPTSVKVLPFTGRTLIEDDLTTDESSDHWSVYGQFKLIRP